MRCENFHELVHFYTARPLPFFDYRNRRLAVRTWDLQPYPFDTIKWVYQDAGSRLEAVWKDFEGLVLWGSKWAALLLPLAAWHLWTFFWPIRVKRAYFAKQIPNSLHLRKCVHCWQLRTMLKEGIITINRPTTCTHAHKPPSTMWRRSASRGVKGESSQEDHNCQAKVKERDPSWRSIQV